MSSMISQFNDNSQPNNHLFQMNQLPNEILVIIFDYLDLKSKLRAESVCKRWKPLIELSFKSKTILLIEDMETHSHNRYGDYKPFHIKNYKQLSVVCLANIRHQINNRSTYRTIISKIISRFTHLKVLYLCFMECPLKKNLLKLVYESCGKHLIHLSVICNDKKMTISTLEVIQFCQKFPNIRVFQFEAFSLLIKEQSIAFMAKMWQNLEVFVLMSLLSNSERKVDVENYKSFCFEDLSPKIKVLQMPGFVLNECALRLMANKPLKQLNSLRIFDLDAIKSITIIADHFNTISSLNCSSFNAFDTESDVNLFFKNISSLCRLRKLHLLIDSDIHIVGHNAIKHLKKCSQLTTIRLESTPLTVDCIEAISKFVPKLLKLELTYVRFNSDSDACIAHIEHLKYLQYLKLSIDPELTDSSIIKIINSCHDLNYIDVSHAEHISTETMSACIEFAKKKSKEIVKVVFEWDLKHKVQQMDTNIPQNLIVKYLYIKKI